MMPKVLGILFDVLLTCRVHSKVSLNEVPRKLKVGSHSIDFPFNFNCTRRIRLRKLK